MNALPAFGTTCSLTLRQSPIGSQCMPLCSVKLSPVESFKLTYFSSRKRVRQSGSVSLRVVCTASSDLRAPKHSRTLRVDNMRCGSCVSRVESIILSASPAGTEASVQLLSNTAQITFPTGADSWRDALEPILRDLGAKGFPSYELEQESGPPPPLDHNLVSKSSKSTSVLVPLILLASSIAIQQFCCGGVAGFVVHVRTVQWISALIAALFVAFPGRDIVVGGIKGIMDGSLSMDSLVTLSVASQLLISVYAMVSGAIAPRFHEALLLLTLVKLGRMIEHEMRRRVSMHAENLTRLQPSHCNVFVAGGSGVSAVSKHLSEIVPGDIVVVRSGERFPVDARIVDDPVTNSTRESHSQVYAVDNSTITGEGQPLYLRNGDSVYAGSINISSCAVLCQAVTTGAESQIALVMKGVEESMSRKAVMQRLADKASSTLTKVALAIAFVSFGVFAFLRGRISSPVLQNLGFAAPVLIAGSVLSAACSIILASCCQRIRCPCGFALAVPLIVLVAMSAGVRQGILFRGGLAVEKAGSHFDLIALDKTGTLTTGDLHVTDVVVFPGVHQWVTTASMVELAAEIQRNVLHPIAVALVRYGKSVDQSNGVRVHPTAVDYVVGRGVYADVSLSSAGFGNESDIVYMGACDWIGEIDKSVQFPKHAVDDGQSRVYVYCKALGGLLGYFDLLDRLRATSQDIDHFRERASQLAVLSGDNIAQVSKVVGSIGLSPMKGDLIEGNLKPHDKVRVVKSLARRRQSFRACAIGDGVNDAPLLSNVHLGIALGNLKSDRKIADVAAAAADILIPYGGVDLAHEALMIGKWSRHAISLCLFWAAAYNMFALILTAGVFVPLGVFVPAHLAAIAMSFSSIVVIAVAAGLAVLLERRRRKRSNEQFSAP